MSHDYILIRTCGSSTCCWWVPVTDPSHYKYLQVSTSLCEYLQVLGKWLWVQL